MDQAKIFNSAQGMFEVAKDIQGFDSSLSDMCLFIAGKLLKIVEDNQPKSVEDQQCEEQTCSIDNMAPTPGGGSGKVVSFQTAGEASDAGVDRDQICVGHAAEHGKECRGHGAENQCQGHGAAIGQGQVPSVSTDEIESDVKSLVTKIRSKMGK